MLAVLLALAPAEWTSFHNGCGAPTCETVETDGWEHNLEYAFCESEDDCEGRWKVPVAAAPAVAGGKVFVGALVERFDIELFSDFSAK